MENNHDDAGAGGPDRGPGMPPRKGDPYDKIIFVLIIMVGAIFGGTLYMLVTDPKPPLCYAPR